MQPSTPGIPLKKLSACLTVIHVLLLPSGPALAQQDNATRQDYTMGTVHEGIVMEKDPLTGDSVIQVTPPPREEEETKQPPALLIQPEIKIKSE